MDIFMRSQEARPGIAATRGFSLQSDGPSGGAARLWQVDTTNGGDVCIAPGVIPTLAQGDSGSPSPTKIVRLANGETRPVVWRAGAAVTNWPAELPVAEGERYSITMDDGSRTPIVWRVVNPSPHGMEGLASALLDKGCHVQLDRLKAVVTGD
jgi:hypothetical protein